MEQIAKETYEGKLKRGELSTEHILKTYAELEDAAKQGYGKNWLKINGGTGMTSKEVIELQKNLWKFSGAKNFAMLEQINQLLVKNGKTVPWEDFKKEVMKLNTTYNKNYLQAEWQTAKQAAKMAANWESYTTNADIYPNLEYRTQQDGRVREAHAGLHGVVAPINSDFWKSHYPPNGWRCRCYVVQTAAEPTKDIPKISEKDHPLEFRGNVGISGEIFKETDANKGKPHPYFALAISGEYRKAFEYSKLAAPLNKVYKAENGATVKVSPFADGKDLEGNLKDAIAIADTLNISLNIRAHTQITKNPEYENENTKVIGDRVQPKTANIKRGVSNAFDDKFKKDGQLRELDNAFLVINFDRYHLTPKELDAVASQCWSKFNYYAEKIPYIILVKDKAVIQIKREVLKKGFWEFKKEVIKLK